MQLDYWAVTILGVLAADKYEKAAREALAK